MNDPKTKKSEDANDGHKEKDDISHTIVSINKDDPIVFIVTTMKTTTKKTTAVPSTSSSSSSTPSSATTSLVEDVDVVIRIPKLSFGLYKVPNDDSGVNIVYNAMTVGYRHFDCAPIYGNEVIFGKAYQRYVKEQLGEESKDDDDDTTAASTTQPKKTAADIRNEFYITSKVWNDTQRQGSKEAIRSSVLQSIQDLQCESYLDLCYIHWPVPKHFISTYLVLQEMVHEGYVRNIGLSNFTIQDYQELLSCKEVRIQPILNQMEVSVFMYRPQIVNYFQKDANMIVASSKSLYRGVGYDTCDILMDIVKAKNKELQQRQHERKRKREEEDGQDESTVTTITPTQAGITPAQMLLRWCYQKDLVVISKTSSKQRMIENRCILQDDFALRDDEMKKLDSLTTQESIDERTQLEIQRKNE